ncbi:ATP-binding protein [Desulfonema magnum]|uniref:AAA ATPase-like domain-containing protein n=1 Tax=Desulfonema magnum TaxID=45655 RepID=A0A975BMV2_9BACT|nr:ATP-binding protein [Desulfonema magnum]QTA88187.1 AAA ATPase-like domain-containing protein [Desulfonema magnum]
MTTYKTIPYGIASYKTIRQENCYYVDKTRYIPQFEKTGKFLFLIRPRRFGKSSLLTVLECYYDIARKEEFELLFSGTYIADHPTPEKNSHLILKFNFSQVSPDPDEVEASFQGHAKNCFFFFGKKYSEFLDNDYFEMMAEHRKAHQKLEFLMNYASSKGLKVYVLIDEYDNFTNTILTTAGKEKYHELTHGAGFFRFFFNILKGAGDQADSGIGRMFITGVSPVTMDDVTSGFNIGRNISLLPEFNELLGFTEQDVAEMLDYYEISESDSDRIMGLMKEWYDNYRFSDRAETTMFNTDMVLYFMIRFLESGTPPDNMIDQNVRTDYGKLRHLIVLDRQLNGNFSYLSDIIRTQGTKSARIAEGFPVERLLKPSNFISLLFYFGLLSHTGTGRLCIPNQTVKKLMYEYLREGYEDTDVFNLDFWRIGELIRDMAYKEKWEPVFRFLADEVEKQTSVRDYLSGEKVIQTFLLAYLNVTDYYVTRSEEEMGKGFADLYLEPFMSKYPDLKYAYLIELKYISRGEFSDEKMKEQLAEAGRQLAGYAADKRVVRRSRGAALKCLTLVFSGWELKAAEAYKHHGT